VRRFSSEDRRRDSSGRVSNAPARDNPQPDVEFDFEGLCLLSATRNGFAASNLFQLLGQVYNCQISSKFTRNDRPEVEQTDLGLAELRTTARRHPDGPEHGGGSKASSCRTSGSGLSQCDSGNGHTWLASSLLRLEIEIMAQATAIRLVGTSQDRLESCHYRRVELALNGLCQSEARHASRHCIPIRTVRGHCVVRVSNRNDLGNKRDLVAAKPIRISQAVDALMMMSYDPSDLGVVVNLREDALTDCRVLFHLSTFFER
jgi:hypothetical protein